MRDDSWKTSSEPEVKLLFTPADAGCLILAVLLHDAAMHLTEDTFKRLIQSRDTPLLDEDCTWPELWSNFLSEASRWDDKTRVNVYGILPAAKPDDLDLSNIRESERRLIGEFIRRHHPRIAHEFGIRGVPGLGVNQPRLVGKAEPLGNLIGLIARSHGVALRSFLPHLDEQFDLREYRGVHAVFIMALLRIADAVQIQPHRAPELREEIQRLHCPLSKREWRTHQSVTNLSRSQQDPEALFVQALPKTVTVFLRLREWLQVIQTELDASWAVMGEVYGRFSKEGFDRFGFVLRRVYSNLDREEQFSGKVSYIPVKASFDTATTELLKWLVKPLYGNRPEVGIRELLQNAVDAVRERTAYQQSISGIQAADDKPQVLISVEDEADGFDWITIVDQGIGMTQEVVINYFLRAGASFRKSTTWRDQFEDAEGISRVNRSGRFGVGALAAFLLGTVIQVKTRHVDSVSNRGIEFEATLDTETIELQWAELPVGTTIRIRLDPGVLELLRSRTRTWDWFGLNQPNVVRKVGPTSPVLHQGSQLPNSLEELPPKWHRLIVPGLDDVHWTYGKEPYLSLNGIKVVDNDSDYYSGHPKGAADQEVGTFNSTALWTLPQSKLQMVIPRVSVFDSNGVFPVNLQRTGLAVRRYPFWSELCIDVARDFLATSICLAPVQPPYDSESAHPYFEPIYPGLESTGQTSYKSNFSPWLATRRGVYFADPSLLCKLGLKSFAVIPRCSWRGATFVPPIAGQDFDAIIGVEIPETVEEYVRWAAVLLNAVFDVEMDNTMWSNMRLNGSRILVSPAIATRIQRSWFLEKITKNSLEIEWQNKDWILLRVGVCPPSPIDYEGVTLAKERKITRNSPGLFSEFYVKQWDEMPELSPIANVWLELLGANAIPFGLENRSQETVHACRALAPYISQCRQCIADPESALFAKYHRPKRIFSSKAK